IRSSIGISNASSRPTPYLLFLWARARCSGGRPGLRASPSREILTMQFLIRKPCKALAAMTASKRQRNKSICAPQGLEHLGQGLPWVGGPLSVRPVGAPESNRTELRNPDSGVSEFFVRSPFSVAL